MGNAYRDVFFTKSDPVIESFRNVLSRCARAVPWFQRSVLNIPKMK